MNGGKNPADVLKRRYILALGLIACLTIASQGVIQFMLVKQEGDAPVINIAGRQRIFSRKLAEKALIIDEILDHCKGGEGSPFVGCDELEVRVDDLHEVLGAWTRSHSGLQHGDTELGLPGTNSPEVTALFEKIEPHYEAMREAAEKILTCVADSDPDITDNVAIQTHVRTILNHEASFLEGTNDIVFQYDREAQARVSHLQRTELILASVILLVLLCEALLVFAPAARVIRKQFTRLRESEEWLSTVLRSLGDAVIATDAEGSVRLMNPAAQALTGWIQEDAKGKPLNEVFVIVNEKTGKPVENPVRRVLQEGVVVGLANHTVLISKDGTKRPIADTGAPIRDRVGRDLGAVLVFSDITERKRAEDMLRQSERHYQALAAASPVGIFRTDHAGNCVYVNEQWCKVAGMTTEEAQGEDWARGLHPEDRERVFTEWGQATREGLPFQSEYRFETPDGATTWVFGQARAERDESGEIIGYVGTVTDITERKRAEEKLSETAALLTNILDTTPDLVFAKDLKLRTILCNEVFARALGKAPAEMVGQTDIENGWDPELVHGNPEKGIRGFEQDDRSALCGKHVHNPNDPANVGGEMRIFDTHKLPLRDAGGRIIGVLGIARDITERKQAEAELLRTSALLANVLNSTPDLISAKDLELRTMMCNKAFAQVLGKTPTDLLGRTDVENGWDPKLVHGDPEEGIRGFENDDRDALSGKSVRNLHDPANVDGEVRFFDTRKLPMRDGEGSIIGVLGIARDVTERYQAEEGLRKARDELETRVKQRTAELAEANDDLRAEITERKRAEEALRESEERFRTSVENMLDCFGIYTAIRDESGSIIDFRIEYVNKAACVDNRMTKQEQIGKRLLEVLPAHRETGLFDKYCQVVERDRPLVEESLIYADVYNKQHVIRAFDIRVVKLGDGFAAAWRDITERKQAEQELRNNQRMLIRAQNVARMGFLTLNMITNEIQWSDEVFDIYGIDQKKVNPTLELTMQLVHPDDLGFVQENLDMAIQGVTEYDIDHRILRPDGKVVWVHAHAELSKTTDVISFLFGTVVDITERKQAEEALKKSQGLLAETARVGKVGGWDLNIDTGIQMWTEETYSIHEVDVTYVPTVEKGLNFYTPASRPIIERAVQRAIEHGEPFDVELEIMTAKGNLRSVHAIGKTDSEHDRVYGFFQDITERKRTEEELEKHRVFQEAVLECIADGIVACDREGTLTYFNRATREFHGLPAEAIPPEEWARHYDLYEADGKTALTHDRIPLFRTLKGEDVSNQEMVIAPKGLPARTLISAGRMLVDSKGNPLGAVVSMNDITERRRAEEQLRRREAELAHVSRLSTLGEMATGLAHELNQPLGAIVNYVEACAALMRSGAAAPEDLYGVMEKASAQAKRAGEIIRRLRNFVRRRAHSRSTVATNDLVRDVVNLAQGDIRSSGVALETLLGDDLPMLCCDAIQIQQVVLNLMQNARDALQEMEPDARCITIRTARAANDAIEIAVSDNGPGLPAEAAERAFEPFFTTKPEGTGLGLSISRSIIEAHGGRLWVTPNPDKGVTFWIHLPLTEQGGSHEPGRDSVRRG